MRTRTPARHLTAVEAAPPDDDRTDALLYECAERWLGNDPLPQDLEEAMCSFIDVDGGATDRGTTSSRGSARRVDDVSLQLCVSKFGVLLTEHQRLRLRCDHGDPVACRELPIVALFMAVFLFLFSRHFDARTGESGESTYSPAERAAIETMNRLPYDDAVLEALWILCAGEERAP